MTITLELIVIVLGILTPVLGGAAAFWRMIERKINDRLSSLSTEVARLEKKVEKLEATSVSRDDYLTDRQSMERAIENIALSLREGLNTVTQRVDLVLFEIGRNNGNKKD